MILATVCCHCWYIFKVLNNPFDMIILGHEFNSGEDIPSDEKNISSSVRLFPHIKPP